MRSFTSGAPEIWGITGYFNPLCFENKRRNYAQFRRHLGIPLVTVELGYRGRYDLSPDDADVLIQLPGEDVLWQRERLLNLALAAVPETCSKIVRLDCDIVFERPDWFHSSVELLERYPMIQPFDMACDQPPGTLPGSPEFPACDRGRPSFAGRWAESRDRSLLQLSPLRGSKRTSLTMGIAWAFRREVHEELGIYDACVVGGGDHAVLAAACGTPESVIEYQRMGSAWQQHYLEWAGPFGQQIAGRLACAPGRVHHLWHGRMADRAYGRRYRDFARFGFDPQADLDLAPTGCWRWGSSKTAMHDYVRAYFVERREDGEQRQQTASVPA